MFVCFVNSCKKLSWIVNHVFGLKLSRYVCLSLCHKCKYGENEGGSLSLHVEEEEFATDWLRPNLDGRGGEVPCGHK